ncbi:MAG: hypothetical protein WKF70_07135, partial [Chitinophagaceae bacterium]
ISGSLPYTFGFDMLVLLFMHYGLTPNSNDSTFYRQELYRRTTRQWTGAKRYKGYIQVRCSY